MAACGITQQIAEWVEITAGHDGLASALHSLAPGPSNWAPAVGVPLRLWLRLIASLQGRCGSGDGLSSAVLLPFWQVCLIALGRFAHGPSCGASPLIDVWTAPLVEARTGTEWRRPAIRLLGERFETVVASQTSSSERWLEVDNRHVLACEFLYDDALDDLPLAACEPCSHEEKADSGA